METKLSAVRCGVKTTVYGGIADIVVVTDVISEEFCWCWGCDSAGVVVVIICRRCSCSSSRLF